MIFHIRNRQRRLNEIQDKLRLEPRRSKFDGNLADLKILWTHGFQGSMILLAAIQKGGIFR